jgi:hypothetical protein
MHIFRHRTVGAHGHWLLSEPARLKFCEITGMFLKTS